MNWVIFSFRIGTSKQKSKNNKHRQIHILGALNDFDAGNGAKSTDKNVDSVEGNASAEVWNEEFISYVNIITLLFSDFMFLEQKVKEKIFTINFSTVNRRNCLRNECQMCLVE